MCIFSNFCLQTKSNSPGWRILACLERVMASLQVESQSFMILSTIKGEKNFGAPATFLFQQFLDPTPAGVRVKAENFRKTFKPKTPKTAINYNFRRLRAFSCIFSKLCARMKTEEGEIHHSIVRVTAHFNTPRPSCGDFRRPAGHVVAEISSRKWPKTAMDRNFPWLCAFSAKIA